MVVSGWLTVTSTNATRTSKMITTFLHDSELNRPTSNKTINELLAEVREKTGQDWQVLEMTYVRKTKWWKRGEAPKKFYELYVFVGGMGPWQQINFYRESADSSINIRVDADALVAYFYGILAGIHSMEMKNVN